MRKPGANGEETFRAIRNCAIDLIYRHGFEAMSNQMLARSVGIEKGTLYYHIKSKEDLLFRILLDSTAEAYAQYEGLEEIQDPKEQIREFVCVFLKDTVKRGKETFIATSELRSLTPAHRRTITALQRKTVHLLMNLLERGVATGDFQVDDARVTTFAIGQLLLGVSTWYDPKGRLAPARLTEIYTRLVFGLLRAPAEPNRQAVDMIQRSNLRAMSEGRRDRA
jgi:AcrR family transcriptional regulator